MSKTKKRLPIRSSRGRSFPAFLSLVVLVPAIGLATFLNSSPMSVAEDRFEFASQNGSISVRSIQQMSVGISTPSGVIVTDPTGAASRYADIRPPDLILISHEHGEHYDPGALEDLAGPGTRIVVPPYVMERLPGGLRDKAIALADGESADMGQITVQAVAAYGLGGQAAQWHPRGRGNSYLVTVEDRKVLVAGSTEAVPEMLALRDIDLAVLPLYPPYALGPRDAARAVATMQPAAVYIYQYNSPRTRDAFVDLVRDAAPNVRVIAPDIPS